MASNTVLKVEFIERKRFDLNFVDKELIKVEFAQVDVLHKTSCIDNTLITNPVDKEVLVYENGNWVNKKLTELLSFYTKIEEPAKINSKRFQTSQNILSGTLEVYFNGLKEKEIIIIDANTFEFQVDTVTTDTIEVVYTRQP